MSGRNGALVVRDPDANSRRSGASRSNRNQPGSGRSNNRNGRGGGGDGANSSAMVVHKGDEYDDDQYAADRSAPPPGRRRRRRRDPHLDPDVDDDVSDVSDVEYDEETYNEPRFKYSTADLADNTGRNHKCCLVVMCILFIIMVLTVSLIIAAIQRKAEERNTVQPIAPSAAPTDQFGNRSPTLPGVGQFQSSTDAVNNVCSNDNFGDNPAPCEDECFGHECCNPFLPQNVSCWANNMMGCLNYARCHVLDGTDAAPENIGIICSVENLQEDRRECETACEKFACCWQDDLSCLETQFFACVDYAPCQNLRSDFQVIYPPSTIGSFCSSSAASVSQSDECDAICDAATCCWADDEADSCIQNDFFTCLNYRLCRDFKEIMPSTGEVIPLRNETFFDEVCSERNINEGNFVENCTQVCEPASCCLKGAADSCFFEDPLGCTAYDICKLVQ